MRIRTFVAVAVVILSCGIFAGTVRAEIIKEFRGGFFFKEIDKNAPICDLLPIPPKATAPQALLPDDLSRVPEVFFQDPHSPALLPKTVADEDRKNRGQEFSKRDIDRVRKKFGKDLSDEQVIQK